MLCKPAQTSSNRSLPRKHLKEFTADTLVELKKVNLDTLDGFLGEVVRQMESFLSQEFGPSPSFALCKALLFTSTYRHAYSPNGNPPPCLSLSLSVSA